VNDEFEPVMSIGHGELRFSCYEIDPDGRERAVYAGDWEQPGSFVDREQQA
jgi:hypothetical protein